jgi:3-phosphoshikimate 1-carboxyvinyltransferase
MSAERLVRPIGGRLDADVRVPGSKSIANRTLICAALADGTSRLTNVPDGDDTTALLEALRRLGLGVQTDGEAIVVSSRGGGWPEVALDAGLAGTTSRFLTALAALGHRPVTIDGQAPLRSRPFRPLLDALAELGVDVAPQGAAGHLPVTVTGPPSGDRVAIAGDVSSQFISALMMIGPRLASGLRIELTSDLVSAPYVELTAAVMRWFGIADVAIDRRSVLVPAGDYRPADVAIEPDASSASYPLALAAVVGGRIGITGLGLASHQGDARFAALLGRMGCGVTTTAEATTVERGHRLVGVDVDMADISDLVPTLAVVAACASSASRIRGVGFIRAKESDRIGDLVHELRTLGVDLDETDDGLDIRPSAASLHGGHVATHHDHRLAMAFGVLGSRVPGVHVGDPDVVSKSWRGYWDMLDAVSRGSGAHQ